MAASSTRSSSSSTRPRRPATNRSGSSKEALAYELGRSGDPAPSWIGDDPRYVDAYERGVDDLDRAGGEPAKPKPAPRKPAAPEPAPAPAPEQPKPTPAGDQPADDNAPTGDEGSSGRGWLRGAGAAAIAPSWGYGDGAGFVLGLFIGWPIALNAFRYPGLTGVTGWLRAKFLNDPIGQPPQAIDPFNLPLGTTGGGGGGMIQRPT